jgi:glucan phosphoethanolaminetransferase (alkaline phosphatase superfamily)
MNRGSVSVRPPWTHSRLGFAVALWICLLAAFFVLRLALFLNFAPSGLSFGTAALSFIVGLHQDLFPSVLVMLPILLWSWVIPDSWFGQLWHRIIFIFSFWVFWIAVIFLCFTEFYFFDEFKSRFNTVAVDYLMYPSEVVGNIQASYPLGTVIAICVIGASALTLVVFWIFRNMWGALSFGRSRFRYFAIAALLCFALWLSLDMTAPIFPPRAPRVSDSVYKWLTARTPGTRFSEDRTLNEISNSGWISFFNALLTRNLDYSAYYLTISRDEAYAQTRKLLASPNAEFVGDNFSIRRKVAGDPARPKLNVVLVLEESLGSEFWGSLGRTNETCTPEMDRLATAEGIFFTNMYACGNRTVRGFEGVLSSFPPLPGDSIVKRDRSENVETIARVLKRDGYDTLFLYGGRGLFDGMRSYALNNGWDRFIEQKDFPNPTFTTIWGVCDEDIFARAIQEFRNLAATGKPFLGTILSVSNHKPFTYPRGRIPEDPDLPQPEREKVVKYSDWCLGKFFRDARQESFWTNTVFIVVADHGNRVYGAEEIPIFSYEIPCVVLGPAVVKEPRHIGTLANSLDVSPTILGLIGRPYETLFFGRDLLNDPADAGRALLNHNRDIGLFAHERMAVLSLQKKVKFYEGDPKVTELKPVSQPSRDFLELETNAMSIYQVADDLYMHRLYHIDPTPAAAASKTATR